MQPIKITKTVLLPGIQSISPELEQIRENLGDVSSVNIFQDKLEDTLGVVNTLTVDLIVI